MNIKQCIKELEQAGFHADDLREALEYIGNPPLRTVLTLLLYERRQGGTPRQAIERARKQEEESDKKLQENPAFRKTFISLLLVVVLVIMSVPLAVFGYIWYSSRTEKLDLPGNTYVSERESCKLLSYNPGVNEWTYKYDGELYRTGDWKFDSVAVQPILLGFTTNRLFSNSAPDEKITEPSLRVPLSYKERMGEFTNAFNRKFEKRLHEIIAGKKAQVGIAVILNHKDTVLVNGCVPFPMLETAYLPLALTALECIKRDSMRAIDTFYATEEMRNPDFDFTLINKKHSRRFTSIENLLNSSHHLTSVKDLICETLQENDESAIDILTGIAGGAWGIDSCMQALGLGQLEIGATARDIRLRSENGLLNRTTPLEAARLMEYIFVRNDYTDVTWLRDIIDRCGKDDEGLAKPLQGTGISASHIKVAGKCGKSVIVNDIGYASSLQDYSIAIFIRNSKENPQVDERMLEDISKAVCEHVRKTK